MISPFVGRIYDWHKKSKGVSDIPREEDPGVASVLRIYNYYKKHGYKTQVMGASFRKLEEIIDLAGCDLLTISPDLIAQLASKDGELEPKLTAKSAAASDSSLIHLDEKTYRFEHKPGSDGGREAQRRDPRLLLGRPQARKIRRRDRGPRPARPEPSTSHTLAAVRRFG